jgi:alkyl hydroperoxide reductase subunit AhpC
MVVHIAKTKGSLLLFLTLDSHYSLKPNTMSLRLGDIAPNFQAKTSIGEIDFYEFLGNSWGILFSHPADFTPVCTTELGKTALLKSEFDKRNVKVLALSVDPVDKHVEWIKDINETQHTSVEFPIIADDDRKVSTLYDFIHPNASATATVRSLLILGPDKAVKLIIIYPASTGRNFNEVLRVVDSLQLTANYSVATPANWNEGEDVIVVPAIKTEDAILKFPKGVKIVKPYLRYTPQPNLD